MHEGIDFIFLPTLILSFTLILTLLTLLTLFSYQLLVCVSYAKYYVTFT